MNNIGMIYVGFAIICLAVAVVAFHFIAKNTKKGTLLIVGAVLWGLSLFPTGDPPVGEAVLIASILRLSGFIGVVLGGIDLFRKPKKPKTLPTQKHPPVPSSHT